MGRLIGQLRQEASGLEVSAYAGWSWPVFFFGPLWYLVKGLWGIGLLYLVISAVTFGIGWLLGLLIMPAIANKQYLEHLGSRGYRLTRQPDA